MVTPELLDFLRSQLATGMSPTEVERLLVEEGGWDKSDVEEGLARIGLPIVPLSLPVPAVAAPEQRVTSMNVAPAPITLMEQATVYEPAPIQNNPSQLPTEPVPEPVELPALAPLAVTLTVRSERPQQAPALPAEDFLGIFKMTSEPVAAPVPEPVVVAEVPLIDVDPQPVPLFPLLPPLQKKIEPVTPNLMEMLAPVSAPEPVALLEIPAQVAASVLVMDSPTPVPIVAEAIPVVAPAEPVSVAPVVKFDLSRIKQEKQEVVPPTTTPIIVSPPAAVPDSSKSVETKSVAELWLTQGKVLPQPAQDDTKEKEIRASLSNRRTMTSDILLRGKGTAIQGLPALVSSNDANPMPQYSSPEVTKAKEARKIVAEKKAELAKPKPRLTPAEEITRKNKIKKTIGIAVGALVGVALVGGGAIAFVNMRGPDVSTMLSGVTAKFFAAPSFTYVGTMSSDLTLTSKSDDGLTRDGKVKFNLDYAGEMVSDKYGYGNGNHHLKWNGGLSSGNFSWNTDVESDLRLIGTNLFFHVLSFPPQADIDPELFKTYWIRVDIAEIAKELALDAVATSDTYNGIAGTESTSFNAVVAKDMPFMGGTKIGAEDVVGVATTHFTLKTNPEKMFVLADDLYKKYFGKDFALNSDGKIRMLNTLEKLKFEIWVDEKTSTLVQFKVTGDLDDDVLDLHVKGPLAMSFIFSKYAAPVAVTEPAPFLTLDELHTRMNDSKKSQSVRSRDAVYINGLGEVTHALTLYQAAKGRFPTTLSELRANDVLATTTLSDNLLKLYLYAPYIKEQDFSKANKCLPKSKTCAVYHIGVNLDDLGDPQLASDADQNSDVHGTDTTGCSLEREKACYDILFTPPHVAASATST